MKWKDERNKTQKQPQIQQVPHPTETAERDRNMSVQKMEWKCLISILQLYIGYNKKQIELYSLLWSTILFPVY